MMSFKKPTLTKDHVLALLQKYWFNLVCFLIVFVSLYAAFFVNTNQKTKTTATPTPVIETVTPVPTSTPTPKTKAEIEANDIAEDGIYVNKTLNFIFKYPADIFPNSLIQNISQPKNTYRYFFGENTPYPSMTVSVQERDKVDDATLNEILRIQKLELNTPHIKKTATSGSTVTKLKNITINDYNGLIYYTNGYMLDGEPYAGYILVLKNKVSVIRIEVIPVSLEEDKYKNIVFDIANSLTFFNLRK